MKRSLDESRPVAAGTSRHHSRTILIASSNPSTCQALTASLRGLGCFLAGPFLTNEAALDWINDLNVVDMALLDIELADGSSIALARALRREGTPLVFFAGFDPRRQLLRAENPNRPGEYRDYRTDDLLDLCGCRQDGAGAPAG